MKIIKRNGTEVEFDKEKIIKAIEGANKEVPIKDRLNENEIFKIALNIENIAKENKHNLNVEEIQDMVEDSINDKKKFVLGRIYSRYRYNHAQLREKNTTDDQILSLINYDNEEVKQENSNKNPKVISVQRDYMAGEVSKDLSKRFLVPHDVWDAHEKGILHFHDSDYFAQFGITNCFHKDTTFITDVGLKSFSDLSDGQVVTVLTKDASWKKATVHYHGKQPLNKVTFSSGSITKVIKVTPDHRWILNDGSVTTNLKVGDMIIKLPLEPNIIGNPTLYGDIFSLNNSPNINWIVDDIESVDNGRLFDVYCIEEPETHSFTLEGGMVTGNCQLVNLDDMLQNGTVISGTKIEKPHSFSTACNIMTQIMAQVASLQYGGQSMSLAHISPFVDVSRQSIKKDVIEELEINDYDSLSPDKKEKVDKIVHKRLKKEINKGVQTIQYQTITLQTTNGLLRGGSYNLFMS